MHHASSYTINCTAEQSVRGQLIPFLPLVSSNLEVTNAKRMQSVPRRPGPYMLQAQRRACASGVLSRYSLPAGMIMKSLLVDSSEAGVNLLS